MIVQFPDLTFQVSPPVGLSWKCPETTTERMTPFRLLCESKSQTPRRLFWRQCNCGFSLFHFLQHVQAGFSIAYDYNFCLTASAKSLLALIEYVIKDARFGKPSGLERPMLESLNRFHFLCSSKSVEGRGAGEGVMRLVRGERDVRNPLEKLSISLLNRTTHTGHGRPMQFVLAAEKSNTSWRLSWSRRISAVVAQNATEDFYSSMYFLFVLRRGWIQRNPWYSRMLCVLNRGLTSFSGSNPYTRPRGNKQFVFSSTSYQVSSLMKTNVYINISQAINEAVDTERRNFDEHQSHRCWEPLEKAQLRKNRRICRAGRTTGVVFVHMTHWI